MPGGIVATFVAKAPKLLENTNQRQPFAPGTAGILREHLIEFGLPLPDLRLGLNRTLVDELRLYGTDNFADDHPRHLQLSAILLDRLLLLKIHPADFRNRLHY